MNRREYNYSSLGFDNFDRGEEQVMYCNSTTSAITSALDHIDASKVYYNNESLENVLRSLSIVSNDCAASVEDVGKALKVIHNRLRCGIPRLERRQLKTLRCGEY